MDIIWADAIFKRIFPSENSIKITTFFIAEKAFENVVCPDGGHLAWPQCEQDGRRLCRRHFRTLFPPLKFRYFD